MPFLAEDFATLDDSGLDGFIAALTARLQATNDALDLGFTRARADIYRVRQYVLGADAASRLVTSPTLADIAVREDSARAKSDQIRDFVTAAYVHLAVARSQQPDAAGTAAADRRTPRRRAGGERAAARRYTRTLATSATLRASTFTTSNVALTRNLTFDAGATVVTRPEVSFTDQVAKVQAPSRFSRIVAGRPGRSNPRSASRTSSRSCRCRASPSAAPRSASA